MWRSSPKSDAIGRKVYSRLSTTLLLSRGSEHLREVARVRVYGEWEKWKKQARPVIMTDKEKEKKKKKKKSR
jgi:hypothetical protein